MASNMKFLLMGYSGYAQIEGVDVHLTSYSLSLNENIIESGGIGRVYCKGYFNRWKLDAVRDYPSYELSLSCEANPYILEKALYMIQSKFHSSNAIKFYDNATKISYEFEDANLNSIEISVSLDAVATINFGFTIFKNSIEVNYCKDGYDLHAKRNAPKSLLWDCLMPYWAWGVSYTDPDENDKRSLIFDSGLCEFSFSYQQSVTPKYGCRAGSTENAMPPMAIVFGMPDVTWNLTYMMVDDISIDDSGIPSNEIALCGKQLEFQYRKWTCLNDEASSWKTDEFHVYFDDVYPTSYSPSVANAGDANRMSVSGTVFGIMSYTCEIDKKQ